MSDWFGEEGLFLLCFVLVLRAVEAYSAPLTPALVPGSRGSFSSASSASVAFGYEGVWWFVALRESC